MNMDGILFPVIMALVGLVLVIFGTFNNKAIYWTGIFATVGGAVGIIYHYYLGVQKMNIEKITFPEIVTFAGLALIIFGINKNKATYWAGIFAALGGGLGLIYHYLL